MRVLHSGDPPSCWIASAFNDLPGLGVAGLIPSAAQRKELRLSALEKAAARGNLAAHRQRLLALSTWLPPGSATVAVAEDLAAALQLDLAFLRSRPDALASTLLWRCAPHEDEPGPLAALVQRWREELPRGPAAIERIRALTPLPHWPGGPLIAELRMTERERGWKPIDRARLR